MQGHRKITERNRMEDDSFIFIVIFLHHVRRMRLNVMKPRRCLFITTKSFFTMKKDFELTGTDRSVDVSLPVNWCFCFDDGCKLAEKCFRRFAAVHLAGGRQSGMAVFRGIGDDGVCDFFLEKRIERQAWGMDKLFEKVFYNDAMSIRKALLGMLGNKGGYYRYNRGEKYLSATQQERVRAVFRRYGYERVEFGHYVDRYWLGD